jgi:hypothetical protein
VVANATLFVSAAAVTPLVVPWSVVVEVPVVEPIVMFVVEPAAPLVPMLTVLPSPVVVAPAARLRADAAVVSPIHMVEAPRSGPTITLVVDPKTPPVAMNTALVVAVRVAPVARLSVDAAVVLPIEVVEAPSTGPTVMLVVEPTTPAVPMLMALVVAVRVAPVPMFTVEAAVVLPKVSVGPEKVLLPE